MALFGKQSKGKHAAGKHAAANVRAEKSILALPEASSSTAASCSDDKSPAHSADKPCKKKRKKGALSRILMIISLLLLLGGIGGLVYFGWDYVSNAVSSSEIQKEANPKIQVGGDGSEDVEASVLHIDIDWDALLLSSPEAKAWIYIPNTRVNYPIVQAEDNDFYLYRNPSGNSNRCGSIFLDCDCQADFSGYHNIIYGHSMQDGSMFRCLLEYADSSYWDEHPYIYLVTADNVTHRLLVISAYTAPSSEEMRQVEFSDGSLPAYIQAVQKKSHRSIGVDASQAACLYSLLTCNYQYDSARMLVHAVEVDPLGNIISASSVSAKANSAAAQPVKQDSK